MLGRLFFGRAVVVGLVLVLNACSIYSPPGGKPAPVEKRPEYTPVTPPVTSPQPPSRPPQPSTTSAWQPLVDKAAQASARGDYEQALALLERAQRIDPDSGAIYLQLAKTHKARGDTAQAQATAERGLLYCDAAAECNALRAYAQ